MALVTVQHAASLQAPPAAQKQRAVFYTHTLCPYAQRVWLTLEEKKVGGKPVASSHPLGPRQHTMHVHHQHAQDMHCQHHHTWHPTRAYTCIKA